MGLWRTSSQHFLLLYAPPEFKSQGLAKALHSLLGEQEDVTVVGWALEEAGGQKPHEKPSRGRGWPLKVPPPPGDLLYPRDAPYKRAGLFLSMYSLFPNNSYFF